MNIGREERAQLNKLAIKGQLDAARCAERLLMDGETIVCIEIVGAIVRIQIVPPKRNSPLWHEAGTCRQTDVDVSFLTLRFGCTIHWTLTRAEAELLRIAHASRHAPYTPERRMH